MKLVGLYKLIKLGEKNPSPHGYAASYEVITGTALVQDTGGIYLQNSMAWFSTSPVIKSTKTLTGYKFETYNSFYELKKVKQIKRKK